MSNNARNTYLETVNCKEFVGELSSVNIYSKHCRLCSDVFSGNLVFYFPTKPWVFEYFPLIVFFSRIFWRIAEFQPETNDFFAITLFTVRFSAIFKPLQYFQQWFWSTYFFDFLFRILQKSSVLYFSFFRTVQKSLIYLHFISLFLSTYVEL